MHVFNFTPEIAHYCAWFAPGVKCFFDARFSLFPDDAARAIQARKGFASNAPEGWLKTFTDRKVDYLAFPVPTGVKFNSPAAFGWMKRIGIRGTTTAAC